MDLSAGGGLLAAPAAGGVIEGPIEIDVCWGDDRVSRMGIAPVYRSPPLDGFVRAGFRFTHLPGESIERLAGFLVSRFLDQESRVKTAAELGPSLGSSKREQVLRVLAFLGIKRRQPLRVSRTLEGAGIALELVAFETRRGRQLMVTRALDRGAPLCAGREYTFWIAGPSSMHFFESLVWSVSGEQVWLTLPGSVRQAGFRESFRFNVQDGLVIPVTIQPSGLRTFECRKNAMDISAWGLTVPLEPARDALFPGERLTGVRIGLSGGDVLASAVIRSVRRSGHEGGLACGIELVGFADHRTRERWGRFVLQTGFPDLALGGQAEVVDAWRMLESSRYLEEVPEIQPSVLERRFFGYWDKQSENSELGRFLLIRRQGRDVGTVSSNQIYPRTWLIHHLGIDEAERRTNRKGLFELARQAYCGIQHVLYNMASLDFFLICADAGKAWNELTYSYFLRSCPSNEDFVFDSYKVYRWLEGGRRPEPGGKPDGIEIVSGNRPLLRALSKHLRSSLHPAEFEAFCYDEEGISLERFSRERKAQGADRDRQVFFAVVKGEPVAALVAESGDAGINVFGLFNRCWIFDLAPDYSRGLQVDRCLLSHAVEYYHRRGVEDFLYIGTSEVDDESRAEHFGFRFVADGLRFLGRKKLLPAFMSFTDEMMQMMHG